MCKKLNPITIYNLCLVIILVGVTTGYAFHLPRLVRLECPHLQTKLHVIHPEFPSNFPPLIQGEVQREVETNLPPAMRGGTKRGGNDIPPTIVGGNKRGVYKLNHDSSTTSESSSWLPRIVVPVVAVAVIATATYLIHSRRGG